MKKTLMSVVMASVLMSGAAMADGSTATLNFEGAVTSSLCQINTADTTKTIVLPEVSAADLAKNNGASTPVSFSIKLENCDPTVTKIQYVIQDNNGNEATHLVPQQFQGSVNPTEVGVFLQDNLKKDIVLGGDNEIEPQKDPTTNNAVTQQTIPLAAYLAVHNAAQTPQSGLVKASATMTIKAAK